MNPLATAFEATTVNSLCLFLVAAAVWLVIQLIFRSLKEGPLLIARGATAFALATALYCGGLSFIMPKVAILDSFDRPKQIADVQDPRKLLQLIQAQHTALVQTIIIQERTAHCLFLVSLFAGIHGLSFLTRMRSAQKEQDYFSRQAHLIGDVEAKDP